MRGCDYQYLNRSRAAIMFDRRRLFVWGGAVVREEYHFASSSWS
jgi:hypothetical protein